MQMSPQSGFSPPSVRVAHPPHVVAFFVSGVAHRVRAPPAVHSMNVHVFGNLAGGGVAAGGTRSGGGVATGATGAGGAGAGARGVLGATGPKNAKPAAQDAIRSTHALQ